MCELNVRFSQSPEQRNVFNYALHVEVVSSVGIPKKIFVYHQSPAGINGNTFAEFDHVATPVDFQEIPEDAASEIIPWYRTDKLTVWVRSASDLKIAKQMLVDDINALRNTYDIMTEKNNFTRQTAVSFSNSGVKETNIDDDDSIEDKIDDIQKDLDQKISKDALSGVEIMSNTPEGMRDAIKTIGNILGATIVKSIALVCTFATLSLYGEGFSGVPFGQLDLDENPTVVTDVNFDGLAQVSNVVTKDEFAPVVNREFLMISSDRSVALAKDMVESAYPCMTEHLADNAQSSINGFSLNIKDYLAPFISNDVEIVKVRLQSIMMRERYYVGLVKLIVKETGSSAIIAQSNPLEFTETGISGRNVTFIFTDDVVINADKRYDFVIVDANTDVPISDVRLGVVSTPKITGLELLDLSGTRTAYNGAWGGGMVVDCIGLASIRIATETDLSGYVPTNRTVNGKALSSDVTLTANDIDYSVSGGSQSVQMTLEGMDVKLLASEAEAEALRQGKLDKSGGIVTGPVLINSDNATIVGPLTLGFNTDPEHVENALDIVRASNGDIYLRIRDTTLADMVQQKLPRTSGTYALLSDINTAIQQIAPAWVSGTSYAANKLCSYNGVVYQNTSGATIQSATTPDTSGSGWTAKPVSDLFLPLTGGTMTGTLTAPKFNVQDGATGGFCLNYGDYIATIYYHGAYGVYIGVKQGSSGTYYIKFQDNGGTVAFTAGTGHEGNLAALDSDGNPVDSGVDKEFLMFMLYYPNGSVSSSAEWTPIWNGSTGIKYEFYGDGTAAVKPFASTESDCNKHLVGRVVIPPYVNNDGVNYKVVGILNGYYEVQTNLTEIIMPTTVKYIGSSAFDGCQSLRHVYAPGVTNVYNLAFSSCNKLTTVELPKTVSINNNNATFFLCSELKYISLESIVDIGTYVFDGCTSLSVVNFGPTARSSVPPVSENTFNNVPNTCMFIIPDSQYESWKNTSGWSALNANGFRFVKYSDWKYSGLYDM